MKANAHPTRNTKSTGVISPMLSLLLVLSFGHSQADAPSELSGELDVIIKEDFDNQRFERDYFLRDANGRDWYQLEFKSTPPGHLRSGQRIKVWGQTHGRKFQVEALDAAVDASTTTTTSELTSVAPSDGALIDDRKAVVLMVDLTNAEASSRYTLSQVAGQMYTNSPSVDRLYREASLGNMGFAPDSDGNGQPDVFGPFAISYDNSTCNYYDWAYATEAAAQAAGIDLSLYRHRVFVLPAYSDLPACAWAGIANMGCGTFCRAWIAEAQSGMVYAHELGHNLGMHHAGTDPENDNTINSAYGDSSDVMGSSRSWHVFNAGHIDQMGWYAGVPGSILTVTGTGVYDLAAIGNYPMSTGAPAALKVAKSDTGEFYYLSFRQASGYDSSLSSTYTKGVNIHRYRGAGSAPTSYIKTLVDGDSFTDSVNGITFAQLSAADGIATVGVNFGEVSSGCAAITPTLAVAPSTFMVRAGSSAEFAVAVTNQDTGGCAGTRFALSYDGIPNGLLSEPDLTLAPGQSGSGLLTLNSALGDGRYDFTVAASDDDGVAPSHSNDGESRATLVVDGTPPTIPTGLSGSVQRKGSKVTLSWTASNDTLSGVADYTVYRDGVAIGQTGSLSFTDSTVASGNVYAYSVAARDTVGNASVASEPLSISVGSTTTGNTNPGKGRK